MNKNLNLLLLLILMGVSSIALGWLYPDRFYPPFETSPEVYMTDYDINTLPMEEIFILESLAGVVAKQTNKPQILLFTEYAEPKFIKEIKESGRKTEKVWYDYYIKYAQEKGIKIIKVNWNPWEFVKHFEKYITGYVLYDETKNAMDVWKACNLAGVKNAIVVSTNLEPIAKKNGLTKVGDVRFMSELEIFNLEPNYFKYLAIYDGREKFKDTWPWNLYWYIATKNFTICSTSINDWKSKDRETILESVPKSYPVWGWSTEPGECDMVKPLTEKGLSILAGNACGNLPILSTIRPGDDFPYWDVLSPKKTLRDLKWEDNVHYASIYLSDTGNPDIWWWAWPFELHLYGHPYRTSLQRNWGFNWGATCGLDYEYNPFTIKYFKETATKNDTLFCDASGVGYFYPDCWAKNTGKTKSLSEFIQHNTNNLYRIGLNTVGVMVLDIDSFNDEILGAYVKQWDRLLGIMYYKYYPHEIFSGKIHWTEDSGKKVPCIGLTHTIWQGYSTPTQTAEKVNKAQHEGAPIDERYFSWVFIHYWSNFDNEGKGFIAAKTFAESCADYIRLVTADELFLQIRLRMDTSNTLNNYLSGIKDELDKLDKLTTPTPEAKKLKEQANEKYNLAMDEFKKQSYQDCFNDAKLADQLTEQARLSYIVIKKDGDKFSFSLPIPMSPKNSGFFFYPYELTQDTSSLKYKTQDYYIVKQFYVMIGDSIDFTKPIKGEYITSDTYTLSKYPTDVYVKVKAQGALYEDWGEWSETIKCPTQKQ